MISLFHQRARLFASLFKTQYFKKVTPVVSNLFITLRCQGQCLYCYTDKSMPLKDELTKEDWCTIVDQLYAAGCRMFNLMGGEPLLHKDFAYILNHIINKKVICDVNTNAFLLPKHLSVLKKTSQIFTSLDGDEKAHDSNRGKGAFQQTLKGILAARKAGIPVRINCTVTHHNTDQIDFLIDLSERLNLFLTFTPLIRIRESLKQGAGSLYLSDVAAKKAFSRIKEAKQGTSRIMNSDASLDYFIHYPVSLNRIVKRDESGVHTNYYTHPCPYGRFQFFIISNGDVYPCHNMWNDKGFTPQNIFKHGFNKALLNANQLTCKYCSLANLVEWNQFTHLDWLIKGIHMTLKQIHN